MSISILNIGKILFLMSLLSYSSVLFAKEMTLHEFFGKKGEVLKSYQKPEKRAQIAKQVADDLFEAVLLKGAQLNISLPNVNQKNQKEFNKRRVLLDYYLNQRIGEHNAQFNSELAHVVVPSPILKARTEVILGEKKLKGETGEYYKVNRYRELLEGIRLYFFDRSKIEKDRFRVLTGFIGGTKNSGGVHPLDRSRVLGSYGADDYRECFLAVRSYLLELVSVGRNKEKEVLRRSAVLEGQMIALLEKYNQARKNRVYFVVPMMAATGFLGGRYLRGRKVGPPFTFQSTQFPRRFMGLTGAAIFGVGAYGMHRLEVKHKARQLVKRPKEQFVVDQKDQLDLLESVLD